MAEITEAELQKASERIIKQFPADEVISEVFTSEYSRERFLKVMCKLTEAGAVVKVGGRRLRELLGYKTYDISEDIISDASDIDAEGFYAGDKIRLGPLIDILKNFPQERMSKPDLDFFIWDATPESTIAAFQSEGFEVTINEATGGVWVINVPGESGMATFVDGAKSWQTGEDWPMFGFSAKFEIADEPYFNLNIGAGRVTLYPLEIPTISFRPILDPKRVAAVGRALLWLTTVSTPTRERLSIPFENSQRYYFQTVMALPRLIQEIKKDPGLEKYYRSGLRDMAVALRIIVVTDWDMMLGYTNYSEECIQFLRDIQILWQTSLWES